jgi:hypothetical protein
MSQEGTPSPEGSPPAQPGAEGPNSPGAVDIAALAERVYQLIRAETRLDLARGGAPARRE